jgi:hypothetical protein
MALWEKILYVVLVLAMIVMFYPSMLAALEKSKQAQEKHWGTVLLLAAALAGFVLLLISLVQ